ncbi:MAG: sulfatase-like hydrolase/transferase [Bacteroidales bacterium]|nr:sulfatase-like hydrolase/transferase [Bacteroidales bacterium]
MKIRHIAGLAALLPLAACSDRTPERPNIVFFLVDDFGWVDSSVQYGDELYPNNLRFNTPNMQRLSERSTVFGNAYACAVSTPTRTSIMTGMNAAHTHITNWTSAMRDTPSDATGGGFWMAENKGSGDAAAGDLLSRPDWNINGISPVPGVTHTQYANSLVQYLKDAGYFTVHVGKAHWASAGTPGVNAYNHGFCVNIAGTMAGMPRDYSGMDNYGNTKERWNDFAVQNLVEYYGTPTHLTEALTMEAFKALDYPIKHKQPFYLYLSSYATHTPIQPDERFAQKYRDAGMDEGQAAYASLVEGVDVSLGQVLDFLDEKGIADNTVIIFMTDNGGNSENKQKGGVLHTQNKPLREGKGSNYEGGIRVPLMICAPGRTRIGKCDVPVICEDMFPTILDIAGVRGWQSVQDVDGESIFPLVTGNGRGPSPERPLVFHYPHKWKPYDLEDIDFLSAIRIGDWKLVYRIKEGTRSQLESLSPEVREAARAAALELYNLKEDIGEENNVAARHPDVVKRLADTLSSRFRRWDTPMPIVVATGRPAPLPDEI